MVSNKVYDILKWIALLVLPALATLIEVVFAVWNIPYGREISATIIAVDAFLGAVLGVSNIQYKKNDGNTVE